MNIVLAALRAYDVAQTVARGLGAARDAAVASLRTTAMHERLHGLKTWADSGDVSMLAHTARIARALESIADRLED